jgi:hypothetical protein
MKFFRGRVSLFAASVLVLALAAPAFPQALTGGINGTSTDASGALIPGVEVTVSSPAMIEGSRSAITNETGSYRFPLLPPGSYTVTFVLPGFATLNIEDVVVPVGTTMTINGTLEVATVAETITVVSETPTIDLQDAAKSINWGKQGLEDLPYGRAIRGLTAMIPGMVNRQYDVGGNTKGGPAGVGSRSYGRRDGDVVMYDGMVWDQTFGDYAAFEEVQITSAAKGAESMNPGSTLSFVIKSGSNDFHGTTYMDWEDDSFQSDNIGEDLLAQGFKPSSNKFTRFNEFNFDIGGPIIRDKFWFYVSWGDMYSGLLIPGFISLETGQPQTFFTSLKTLTTKFTYQLTNSMKLESHGSFGRKWQPYRNAGSAVPAEATHDQLSYTGTGPTLKLTNIISPTMTMDVALSRGGYYWPSRSHTTDIRQFDRATGETRGSWNVRYLRPIRWQYDANFSWFGEIGGRNNEIKTGTLNWWSKSYRLNFGFPNQQEYHYRSQPGDATFFERPNRVRVYDYPNNEMSVESYKSWYINDKLTVNNHLTLNFGIRWDHYSSYLPEQGNPGDGPFATKNLFAENRDFPVYNSVVPRLSMVYDVTGEGKVALKASYGRYAGGGSGSRTIPAPNARHVNPAGRTRWQYAWDGTIPYVPNPADLQTVSGGGGGIQRIDSNVELPYMDEYTAGIELGFTRDMTMRFNVVRKQDFGGFYVKDLARPYEAYTDVRYAVDPGRDNVEGTADDGQLQAWSVPRSWPTFADVNELFTNVANDEAKDVYTSYEATFNKRHAGGWSILASYQSDFAKIRCSERRSRGCDLIPQNPNDLLYTFNLPRWHHSLKLHGQYDLPYGVMFSSSFRSQSGDYYGREALMRNALNSTVVVPVEEQAGRLPRVNLWDNRFSKTFQINDRHSIEAMIDFFNTLNVSTVLRVETRNGPRFGLVRSAGTGATSASPIVPGRIFRLAARWRF